MPDRRRWTHFCTTWTRKSRLLRSIHSPAPSVSCTSQSFRPSHNNLAPYGPFWQIELIKVLGLAEKVSVDGSKQHMYFTPMLRLTNNARKVPPFFAFWVILL